VKYLKTYGNLLKKEPTLLLKKPLQQSSKPLEENLKITIKKNFRNNLPTTTSRATSRASKETWNCSTKILIT
jgi:hypothetical protein